MENKNLVLVDQCCTYYNVEISFFDSLEEYGFIDITHINDERYLNHKDLKEVEKMIQFYYNLGINMEGIDAITHLLLQIKALQYELETTKNKLRIFESED